VCTPNDTTHVPTQCISEDDVDCAVPSEDSGSNGSPLRMAVWLACAGKAVNPARVCLSMQGEGKGGFLSSCLNFKTSAYELQPRAWRLHRVTLHEAWSDERAHISYPGV